MYTVDDLDSVRRLDGVPRSSVGAPLPASLCDEHSTFIAYLMEEHDPNWDGTTIRIVGPASADESIAILRFLEPKALMFGPPNDEAFAGHPLESRGLTPNGAFEVLQSSWIRRLERMNSVHPFHRPERYAELRHFILSFHDSTFECVARGIQVVELLRGSMNQAITRMAALMAATAS